MSKKNIFISYYNNRDHKDVIAESSRIEIDSFSFSIRKTDNEDNFEAIIYFGHQSIKLLLPALRNSEGQPIIELKKHNVASFDPETDTRHFSVSSFTYFLESVEKIEIVNDDVIIKDALSSNQRERVDYVFEKAYIGNKDPITQNKRTITPNIERTI